MLEKAEEDRQRLPLPVRPPPVELRRNIAGENGHGACVSVGAVTLALHPRLTPRWRPKRSTTRRVFVDEWIVFFTWWLLDFQYAMIQIF